MKIKIIGLENYKVVLEAIEDSKASERVLCPIFLAKGLQFLKENQVERSRVLSIIIKHQNKLEDMIGSKRVGVKIYDVEK